MRWWDASKDLATRLAQDAQGRLLQLAYDLTTEIANIENGFGFRVEWGSSAGSTEDRRRALTMADHIPDFDMYDALVQLSMQTGTTSILVLSFQAIGPRFRGLISVIPYLTFYGTGPSLIEDGLFQINYEESPPSARKRFSAWLDRVIVNGLNKWRLTL